MGHSLNHSERFKYIVDHNESMEKAGFFRVLFLVAAIYDFVLGIIFLLFYKQAYTFLNITLPVYPMYLQMVAAFVTVMGIAYYFAYLDMYRNIDLVKVGVIFKGVYAVLTSYFYFADLANVVFFWFAIIDVVFLVLFVWFLASAKKDERKWR